jgi:TetR/AcrR family transcriptional regulator, transcriptional repressor for nem operon
MRYPAVETEEKHARILKEASRLFRERGFANVSVHELMSSTGLTRGPFYNHFDSKEQLIAECVAIGMQETLSGVEQHFQTAAGRRRYIERYLSARHRDSPGTGCTMAAVAQQVQREPEARSRFTGFMKKIVGAMSNGFPARRSARREALHTLASAVGGLILARAVDDEGFSLEILDAVRQTLNKV